METLQGYVKRIMEETGQSALAIERRTHNEISDTTVRNIVNGVNAGLTLSSMIALADGLGVDLLELFMVAAQLPPLPPNDHPMIIKCVKLARLLIECRELADRAQKSEWIAEDDSSEFMVDKMIKIAVERKRERRAVLEGPAKGGGKKTGPVLVDEDIPDSEPRRSKRLKRA